MNLDELAHSLHNTAVNKGFWDNYSDSPNEFICTKLALIHSEVTEVLEAIRKSKTEQEIMDEFADIIIRTLDLYAGMNELWFKEKQSLQLALSNKRGINSSRQRLHGNKF
jgi:NTP pyrophosphatase (non-canonical NTP hydrolase)